MFNLKIEHMRTVLVTSEHYQKRHTLLEVSRIWEKAYSSIFKTQYHIKSKLPHVSGFWNTVWIVSNLKIEHIKAVFVDSNHWRLILVALSKNQATGHNFQVTLKFCPILECWETALLAAIIELHRMYYRAL